MKLKNALYLNVMVQLLTVFSIAGASEGKAHFAEHITVPGVVAWQAINLIILFSLIYVYTKEKVVEHFAKRRSNFLEAAEKSRQVQAEAEKSLLDIKHKLDLLSSSTAESISRARAEAADLKKLMMADALEVAKRIRQEAKETARLEVQRAYQDLKKRAINEAIFSARQILTKDIGSQDHQNLQNDFSKSLSGVPT